TANLTCNPVTLTLWTTRKATTNSNHTRIQTKIREPALILLSSARTSQSFDRSTRVNLAEHASAPRKRSLNLVASVSAVAKKPTPMMKTMDNMHDWSEISRHPTRYSITCARTFHGDPYFIQRYLMEIKYEEGFDLTEFFLKLENAMQAASDATESVMTKGQKSIYLFHSAPKSWKDDLRIWKGQMKYIPYEDLEQSIEGKVRDLLAQGRYTLAKGHLRLPQPRSSSGYWTFGLHTQGHDNANVCSYCDRPRHNIRQCRGLQKVLRDGRVKAGTVLPANFAFKWEYGRHGKSNNNRGFKGNNGISRTNTEMVVINAAKIDTRIALSSLTMTRKMPTDSGNRKVTRQGRRDTGLVAVVTTVNPPFSLTAQAKVECDPTWTVDSGCTRHWFTDIPTIDGSITVSGNNQILVEGIGRVEPKVSDSKGTVKKLILHGVVYAAQLQFSLLSVPAAVKHDFRFSFDRKQRAKQTYQRFKIKAIMATNTNLYRLQVNPAAPPVALITSGKQRSFVLLHKRLEHPNVRVLNDLSRSQVIHGLDGSVPLGPKTEFFCVACTLAKSHRYPFYSNRVVKRATSPLSKVHSDICGSLPVPSLTGCRYFLIFIDDFSRFMFTTVASCMTATKTSGRKALNIFRQAISVIEYMFSVEANATQGNFEIQRL
ncbi:LOW QUALITY PROTEIN: hypothetical protein PHMEG_00029773, partial [Phytophthora megakarya]